VSGAAENAPPGHEPVVLDFAATPDATRQALGSVRAALAQAGLAPMLVSRVEMVLAEVLNNIVEHAYTGEAGGRAWLVAQVRGGAVSVTITDRGTPVPRHRLGRTALPDADVPRDRLPEGGFGWYLIHSQTDSLGYRREDGANILELRFWPHPGA